MSATTSAAIQPTTATVIRSCMSPRHTAVVLIHNARTGKPIVGRSTR